MSSLGSKQKTTMFGWIKERKHFMHYNPDNASRVDFAAGLI